MANLRQSVDVTEARQFARINSSVQISGRTFGASEDLAIG
jgi:hypothetical protein